MTELIASITLNRDTLIELDNSDYVETGKQAHESGYLRLIEKDSDQSITAGIYVDQSNYDPDKFKHFVNGFTSIINRRASLNISAQSQVADVKTQLNSATQLPNEVRQAFLKVWQIAYVPQVIIKPLTDGEAVDFGDGLNEYIGQYDTSDWNNDVFHMQMFKIGSGELYRVEITFDVDGTSDTDWESGAKWIILLNPKADKLDRVVYLGLDPCTDTASDETIYTNDRVASSDGHFEILDDVPHTVVAKNGFVSTDIEMQAHNQKYPNQKIEYDSTDQVTIYNIFNPPLTASLAFHYKASPWFSYNTDEYVTGPVIKARLMSILNEISETSPDNNPFKIVWMGTTNLGLIPTINSNQRSDAAAVEAPAEAAVEAPTPAEEVAGEAPTEEVAGPAQTQESSDEEEIPGSD